MTKFLKLHSTRYPVFVEFDIHYIATNLAIAPTIFGIDAYDELGSVLRYELLLKEEQYEKEHNVNISSTEAVKKMRSFE